MAVDRFDPPRLGLKVIAILGAALATAAAVGTVDLSSSHFDPSLLDGIKHKVKQQNLTGCCA